MSRTADANNQSEHTSASSGSLPWRRWIRVGSVGATVGAIVVMGSVMLTSNQQSSAATPAGAAVGRVGSDTPAPSASMPADMPGMDMSGGAPAPTASMPADMPGMDMGGSSSAASASRPLAPVLGTFGAGAAAVLVTAGMLRRKDQATDLAKKAARISGRGRK